MHFIPYNSRDTRHKSIFGSTAAGDSLRLAVLMPRNFSCCKVTLIYHKDGESEQHRDLFWCGMNGDNEEWWDINFTFEASGLYYYHFTYETPFGKGNIFLRSGGCGEFAPTGNEWQQTVYKKEYVTPDWVKGGIMYQIFPDRFNTSQTPVDNTFPDRQIHKTTTESPVWKPNAEGKILNNDYFGGTLKGIEEKLPYLSELGVTILYLNPIFEAHSNHRYNTADYMKIDPMLGNENDFRDLCKKADEYGIKIILDGVFSHTGSDSIYFNRENRYDTIGAYNSPDSPYKDWFTFKNDGTYKSWWGIDTLPETNEDNPSFINYIAGENGVARKWLENGAAGFRLDVADELPDKFLDEFNKCVKSLNKDYFVIGEVWEDATNKFSHGGRRRYLLGDQLDSVMNYPFAAAILSFMRYGVAENFMESIVTVCENYPPQALHCLMNHIGTHDTARVLTALIYDSIEHKPRNIQASCTLSPEEYTKAKKLLKAATVLQYTLPGFPSVYYGDEAGMQGGGDPFNRSFFPWDNADKELTDWYKKLGNIRRNSSCLKDGAFVPYSAMLSCVAYKRYTENETMFVIVNRNNHEIDYYLPDEFKYKKEILHGGFSSDFVKIDAYSAVILKI
ncbi:MAG: glycoside hydrolase family 13 protein [Clostridia bacterium]|nr:glycoside hydrolase family 13 protein [Clostridia bacterium]